MALFRKFFYRKPPERLLEISERVYVFECCFSMDALGDDKYRDYVEGVVSKLRDHWPDGSFVVFNFLHGKNRIKIGDILSAYDITVMDFFTQYENCPLLTLEMIHLFLKSSESWLDLGERNILLMHCERGGWPVLAFVLAALLIYRKQSTGEQKTLDMIYKQAPPLLLESMSQMNPLPSQLRYLQYVSGRNLHLEWLPQVRSLMLHCIVLRVVPCIDAEGGCCPIIRIYGLNPVMEADQVPKMIYSTPKGRNVIQHYKKADCDLVKVDINCHIKGDVLLECITLDNEMNLEETMFRIMFNTAFIKSNMLILSRDEIDTQWNVQDHFSRDFKAEILFSEMGSSSLHLLDLPVIEASANPKTLRDVDRLEGKDDVERNKLRVQENFGRVLAAGKENLDSSSSQSARIEILDSCSPQVAKQENQENPGTSEIRNSKALESDLSNSDSEVLEEQDSGYSASMVLNSRKMKTYPEELQPAFLRPPVQSRILSPRIHQGSLSNPASHSMQESLSRYQNTHSALGITALLHDTSSNNKLGSHVVTLSPKSSLSASFPQLCKSATPSLVSVVSQSDLRPPLLVATRSPVPPPPPPPLVSSPSAPISPSSVLLKSSICNLSPPKELDSPQKLDSNTLIWDTGYSETACCPSTSAFSHSGMSLSLTTNNSVPPPPPPPPPRPVFSRTAASMQNSSTSPLLPPVLPPCSSSSNLVPVTTRSSVLPALHEITSSTESMSSLEPNKSLVLETSPLIPPPLPRVNSVSDSNDTVKSSSSPSSAPLLTALSSSENPSSSSNSTSLINITTPQFSDVATSIGQISLMVPEKKVEIISIPSMHSVSLSNANATATSLAPQSAPLAKSLPSLPLRESLSPAMNSCSTMSVSLSVSSLSDSISSHVREKSSETVARPPQPPSPPPPSVLPPPTPPSLPPKESIARISPKIPPPPAPLSSALPKVGATLQSISSARNGIPPTPAPPVGAKGRLQSNATAKPQSQTKKSSLKPYHWLKLTRALQGSIWAETKKPEEASKTPEFDMSELESLFSATVLTEHGSTHCKSKRTSKSKSDKVNLIDFRRAYNCEIMLTKIKIPLPDIMSSVLSLDDSALDADQVDNLIKFCPTKEEMEFLKNYNGDIEKLGKCEQFLMEMMKVPRADSKLRVFSFRIQFHSRVSDLRGALNLVNSASEEVRSSIKLKRVMQSILSLGNALNHGTARGSAIGFRLDSLLKLSDTRARNNKMTLMHYLCKVLAEKLPELLDFPKDLISLEAATRIQLKYLAEEMQAISKGLEKVTQELIASENDGPVSESFRKTLKEFLNSAETEVRSLSLLYSVVGKNADALAQYFGEDPARCPFEQVISTLLNFVRMFIKAHEENCKRLEFAKKRAQKDAANERAMRISQG